MVTVNECIVDTQCLIKHNYVSTNKARYDTTIG